ncbi:MAG: phosphoribosylanthranilate isomerase [Desulfobacterales bacterium]|nr:phosphoribosylanthranilate isomerase [Desulfobacterales bacterium]
MGADALGLVFYPQSPRYVTDGRARQICAALPSRMARVGVFVNETFPNIMRRVNACRLSAVQLHGQEKPEMVTRLRRENIMVIKTLFIENSPPVDRAPDYDASAFLVEWGQGIHPGGNALEWDYGRAQAFGRQHPFILAGGLTPENVIQAVTRALPDMVDVSSGVESSPGQKDLAKVKSFFAALSSCPVHEKTRRIF